MSKIELKNAEGKAAGTVELDSSVFGIEPNIPVIHQVVTVQLGNLRQGTHDTKGRSEVSGGGAKPWRQKGTGRARQGSIRATQWVGGGVPFGPTPRSHNRRLNNKEIKLAMRGVLVSDDDIYTYLSFRNVETVRVIGVGEASTHSLIDNAALVLSSAVAKKLEEVLA